MPPPGTSSPRSAAAHSCCRSRPGRNNTQILDTAVRPNGRVLVAGVAYQDGELADGDGFVAEFEPTGELNDDFGTGGIQLIAVNIVADGDDIVFDIEIADDGTVVGTGDADAASGTDIFVFELEVDGDPNALYGGGDGVFTLNIRVFDQGRAVDVMNDGDAVVAGAASDGLDTNAEAVVARVASDGTAVDGGFGASGTVFTAQGGTRVDVWRALEVHGGDGDDVITVGGVRDANSLPGADIALGRFAGGDGAPNASFGGADGAIAASGPGMEGVDDVAVGPAGDVVTAETRGLGPGQPPSFETVSWYTPMGQPQPAFGGDGSVDVDFAFDGGQFAGSRALVANPAFNRFTIAGHAFDGPSAGDANFSVVTLDEAGAERLKRVYDVAGHNDFGESIAVNASTAYVGGTAVVGDEEQGGIVALELG